MLELTGYIRNDDGRLIHVPTTDEICDMIKARVKMVQDAANSAQKELRAMREEAWKDEALASMKEQVKAMEASMQRGFPLTEEQSKKAREWQIQHRTKIHFNKYAGAINGSFSYHFTPTSIGVFASCRCDECYRRAMQQTYREKFEAEREGRNFEFDSRLEQLVQKNDAECVFQSLK